MWPPTIEHPRLGTLSWDGHEAYRAPIELLGKQGEVAVIVDPGAWDEPHSADDLVAVAASVLSQLRVADIRAALIRDLFPLYNDAWRGDRPKLGEEEFIDLPCHPELAVYHDGSATIDWDDGSLFYGHQICVRLSSDGEVTDVLIQG